MPSPKRKQGYVVVPTDEDADGTTPVAVEAVEMSSGLASKPAKAHSAGRRSPAERAGWVSQLFFRWLSPIFTLGASATLQPEDLDGWPLRTSDNPAEQAAAMDRAWRSAAAAAGPTAEVPFKAVCWAAFGRRYMAVGLCKVPYWVALFAQPLILRALLAAISTTGGEEQGPEALGALVVGLGLSTLGISLSSMHLFVWAQTMGMNVRAGIGSLIYTQALRLRPAALAAAAGPSEVLTLLSADTERIVNALSFFHFLYTAPIEIGGALFLAWQQLGSAAVAGLGVMLLLSPLQTFLGNRIGRLRKSAVRHTDERVRTIAECLHGIGTVKLLCAEQLFLKRVSASREREIRTLRRAAVAKMCNAAAAFTTQMLVALATFSLHVYLQPDEPPRPEQLFSGLACFNVINNTLSMVPRATEALAEAMVASSRISAFLNLAEQSRMSAHRAQSSRVARSAADEDEVVAIALRGVSFSWAELEGSSSSGGSAGSAAGSGDGLCLRDINAEIGKGQLTAVIGPVGAGKSSFLAGLLGELELMRTTPTTKAQRDGDSHANAAAVEWLGLAPEAAVAFVAQTPFLLQASVRENIVLQHPYVADRYAAVVSACGMSRDITGMAAGDATEVSEGGSSLSGGQQMRLSLARAVYGALSAEKPGLVLLDDPLSALDNHLGRHVFEQCICGLLKGHTVVMATHAVHFLHAVDRVILLDSGIVQCVGAPSVLEESQHPLATAYRAAGTPEPEPELEPESELEPGAEGAAAGQKAVTIPDTEKRNTGTGAANLTSKEDRTAGAVVWDTYATYVRAAGGGWSALMVVALYVVGQLVFLGGDLWLAGWADRNSALGSGQQHQQQQAQLCDLAACRCGPYDLSTMRGRTFRAPIDEEGFGIMFRICEDIPPSELPFTCQAEQAPAPHPAAARYLYGLEECTLLGSFGPCPDGIDCGVTYELLAEGGLALTYRYDDSEELLLPPLSEQGSRRRLDELAPGRPEDCASSFRLELHAGHQPVPEGTRLISEERVSVSREAGSNLAPMLGDTTGPCHSWAVAWDGLNAFGAGLPQLDGFNGGGSGMGGAGNAKPSGQAALATQLAVGLGLDDSDSSAWMHGYAVLTALALVLAVVRSTCFVWLALAAARGLHDTMASTILHAPMRFFEENPRGRLLNRFASDLDKVDSQLPTIAGDTLRLACTVLGAIAVCLALLPPLVVALVPCWVAFRKIQRYYLKSSRELARLEATARSPLYALFTASLHGLPTIRAAQLQPYFAARFQHALEKYHRPHWLGLAGRRWVAVRFDGVANALITAAAVLVLWLRDDGTGGGGLSAGLAGVALTQALQLVGMFQYAVRQAAETENLMTAVERVRAFTLVRREGGENPVTAKPPPGWPAAGRLELDRLTLRYRPGLEPALRRVSLVLQPGERIGVVGRSGAGKSSLFGAIFRLVEPESGRVMLDGVDCGAIGLGALRAAVGIIPQEPLLFSGTLRMNLDPSGGQSDGEIGRALEVCGVGGRLRKLTGGQGLDWSLVAGGTNLSQGERQLMCLARALLRKPRVLLLDEATATVDLATDEALQRAVKLEGAKIGWSMLTVAHRLQTIMDYDRVAGMAGGQVVELDVPATLLQRADSLLSLLVAELHPQSQEQLRQMAIAADKKQLGMLSWPGKKEKKPPAATTDADAA